MSKLLVFDLDGTLAELGRGIEPAIVDALRTFMDEGAKVCLSSGKPAAYLAGLCRQANLSDIILIGENGANIYFSAEFPPRSEIKLYDPEQLVISQTLKQSILKKYASRVWMQPGEINVTCFYVETDKEAVDGLIKNMLDECFGQNYSDVMDCFIHQDAIEFVHQNLNKGNALKRLLTEMHLSADDVIVVGDSVNDYPMFAVASRSIGINLKDKEKTTDSCDTIDQAVQLIRTIKEVNE